ncbi:RNA polymerase sigma-70 factor [Pedobacter sp. L105]|uniref:RNA polymerase sigma-70 factor n=1 Tax=Pedobacter sp. L105 TaxID=1641871 RepID=UPI00131AC46D|nr:RNA polymerase sigma-70 factor [Pedobacter sp. L105]
MIEKGLDLKRLWTKVAIDNDHQSFEKFFILLNTKLIKFCELYVNKKEIAEEIVADVFVNFWNQRMKLVEVDNLETYIFISVKNRSLNHIKKNSLMHLVQIEDSPMEFVAYSNPEAEIEKKELFYKLDQAIDTLPQQCKIIFQLVKEDGMKYKEVSEILNISHKTVQSQVLRAMQKLSKEMSPYLSKNSTVSKFMK